MAPRVSGPTPQPVAIADAIRDDERVPGSAAVACDGGVEAITAFLRANNLELLSARAQQLRAMPGTQWAIRHVVHARARDGACQTIPVTVEATRRERVLPAPDPAVARRLPLQTPALRVGELAVWAFPYDPDLPELAPAVCGPRVRDALRAADLLPQSQRGVVSCEVLRYRQGRRAVLRYTLVGRGEHRGGSRRLYGKVLRPHRARRLHDAVSDLQLGRPGRRRGHLPLLAVPTPLFGGAMVTAPMPGQSLRHLLLANRPLPDPSRVAAVPNQVARLTPHESDLSSAVRGDGRRDPARLARYASAILDHALPDARGQVARVLDAVHRGMELELRQPQVVHGDFYDDQVFVDDGYGLGLIDLDDIAVGDPALDGANLCAHLLALAIGHPAAAPRLVAYRALVRAELSHHLAISPAGLAWREALAVLLLATGPLRVLSPQWQQQSRRLVDTAVRLATTTCLTCC